MSTTSETDAQQRHLREAMRDIPRGHPDYARRVIFATFARLDLDPPFVANQRDVQPSFCADCSTAADPVLAEFHWIDYGSLCAVDSLARLDGDMDKNPRVGDAAKRRGEANR